MKLAEMTWTETEAYLHTKNAIIVPVGSTEQHGPTGLIGTDYMTAEHIAEKIANKLDILSAPPICYGMALHHMAFPGTVSLSTTTFISVICDVIGSLDKHGFKKIFFINGHGGNISPITTAFCEYKNDDQRTQLELFNWWKIPALAEYDEKHFGDEAGLHATVSEVAVTMDICPEAFERIPQTQFVVERPNAPFPLSPLELREAYPDGRMRSNPGLSTRAHGKAIIEIAVEGISERVAAKLS